MGLDIRLYAEGNITDDQLATAEQYLQDRFDPDERDMPLLHRQQKEADWYQGSEPEPDRVTFNVMDRFYGPGYERGNWPKIYGFIRALAAALPHCQVFYGNDVRDEGTLATDEYLDEIWQHFLGPEGADYHHPPTKP